MGTALFRSRPAVDPLEEVLDRYLVTGDEEALERVVRETRPRLLAAARRIGAPQDAEDAVQSAYLSLVRKRGAPLRAPVFPWLLTAVVRIAYRRKAVARRQDDLARRLARPLDGPTPLDDAAAVEGEERLRRELDRLPDRYRDPVVLHDLQGLTAGEVGRLLDLPEATVRTRVRRARALLRWRLPPGLAYGLLMVPWFLQDAVGSAGGGAVAAAAMGGTMKGAAVAVVALAAVGIGALVGTQVGGGGVAPDVLEKRVAEERAKADAAGREAGDLRSRVAAIEDRVSKAEARASKAESDLAAAIAERDAARSSLAAAKPSAAADAPAATAGSPISFPEYDEVLGKVDWKSMGTNTRQMLPLLVKLREGSKPGAKFDVSAFGRIQKLNGALIDEAGKFHEALPGTGINGAFTHPSVMANSMVVTLEDAGKPLTSSQVETLGKIGREFSDRDRARESGYDERTPALQKALEEAALKDQFFEAAAGLMNSEQRDVLWPPAIKGLLNLDLFSSAIMLGQLALPLPAKSRDEFATRVESALIGRLGVPEDKREAIKGVVAPWAAELPAAWFETEFDVLAGATPILHKDFVLDAGRRLTPLMLRITNDLGLDEATAKRLRDNPVIFVPWFRKGS
ncbi:MAG TPA: RNA polymerase sigma factor [Planctomycetota bacterium]|nr:RNA polymerase sigma factor [Planctomycetota bacterium]